MKTQKRQRGLILQGLHPLVVILGKPNVGKSTLFNRILRERKAITDAMPGVTRDPIEAHCRIGLLRTKNTTEKDDIDISYSIITLVDTGGISPDAQGIEKEAAQKCIEYVIKSNILLFVVDGTNKSAEDEALAHFLQKYSDKLILVVNKIDNPQRELLKFDFASWGFTTILNISAEHGLNIDLLEEELQKRLPPGIPGGIPLLHLGQPIEANREMQRPVRVVIIGKPNTGKSTLLNALVCKERNLVSPLAGTTRDAIDIEFAAQGHSFILTDTAGLRRVSKIERGIEYYSYIRTAKVIEECDIAVLMISSQEGLSEQDKKIAALVVEKGKGLILALAKWDLPGHDSIQKMADCIRLTFGQVAFAPLLAISAKEGKGLTLLIKTIVRLYSQLQRRIDTSTLNKALASWLENTPPPVGPKSRFKIRYAVHTSVLPQRFALFVSRPIAIKAAYITYIKKMIRKDLGLQEVPLTIDIRPAHNTNKDRGS